MSITGEFRHGLIRPTLLVTPGRTRVVLAKILVAVLLGAVIGLAAQALAVTAGTAGLASRGIDLAAGTGQLTRLVLGGALAAAGGGPSVSRSAPSCAARSARWWGSPGGCCSSSRP